MAAIIGDFISDPARSIHNMIANPPLQQHRHHPHSSSHETSSSSSSFRPALRQRQSSSSSTATARPAPPHRQGSASERSVAAAGSEEEEEDVDADESPSSRSVAYTTSSGAAAPPAQIIPSPPSSSSPTRAAPAAADNVQDASMATDIADPVPRRQQPSPPSDDFTIPSSTASSASTTIPPPPAQTVIRVRDLAHIQTLARSDILLGSSAPASTLSGTASPGSGGVLNDPPLQQMKYDVSAMPINDIIEMVAALLTKITTTNDLQHDAMQRSVTAQQHYTTDTPHAPSTPTTNTATSATHLNPLSHSVLAFHGKNVPAITIHSYLARIHRYCPTTFEVFLSLLVYFDRMTERVNDLVTRSEEARRNATTTSGTTTPGASARPPMSHHASSTSSRPGTAVATTTAPATVPAPLAGDVTMRDEADDDSDETDSDLADDDDDDDDDEDDDDEMEGSASPQRRDSGRVITAAEQAPSINGPTTYFVVDSFNIHRLIIAGVTCSSKFFSDVFYTNSRYAKVGGLPLAELNHLELQFLVLNDFRLAVPVEDLEAYATMLVEFYAREVVAQRS